MGGRGSAVRGGPGRSNTAANRFGRFNYAGGSTSSHVNGGAVNKRYWGSNGNASSTCSTSSQSTRFADAPSYKPKASKHGDLGTITETNEEGGNQPEVKRPNVKYHDFLNDSDVTVIGDNFDWLAKHTVDIPIERVSSPKK